MYRALSFGCLAGLFLCSGTAHAQVPAAGGVVGGVTGTAAGAVNGTVAPGGAIGAVGGITDTARGDIGAGVGNGPVIGAADAVTTMRQNAALSSSAQPLLPKGMTPTQAAAGFTDTENFMTAVHAAHDLNIPFDQFKAETTGKGHMSFDKAARKLRPDLDEKAVKENLKLAEKQSNRDMVQASAPAGKDQVASKFVSDSDLSSRASTLLPPGSSVTSAATGFHDENQFLSTAQASHNLNLPFEDMKDRVTAGQSLSDAIHAMKPDMSESEARASAKTASSQAAELRSGKNTSAHSKADANAGASGKAGKTGVSAEGNADAGADARIRK